MNIEENRLLTFRNWPEDAVIGPIPIARAGFYSLNRDLTVQCFSCGTQISEWNYGDQAMARHRQLNPECEFVLNPSTSGNMSYLGTPNGIPNEHEPTSNTTPTLNALTNEDVRLQSFENWPVSHIVTPQSLARAGFYYLKHSDKTQCAYCNGIVVQWEVGDDPDVEHKRHFPNCSFVQRVIIPRLDNTAGAASETDNNYQEFTNVNIVGQNSFNDLGINAHKRPKKSKYSTLDARLQTFSTWPDDLIQTPSALAEAGFYYEGFGDQVRCFHCDGGLRHWDPHDDPWTEHCRWFPECPYVLLVKGQAFVAACALDTGGINLEQESRRTTRPVQHREVTDSDIQAQMLTPEVIAALNIGLHVGRIKQAIREKLQQTGTGFSTADAVIEAALNLQRDEEEAPENTQISQEVTRILTDAIAQSVAQVPPPTDVITTGETPAVQVATDIQEDISARSLEEENRLLKEARLCKICMDIEVGIVFLPCGHLTTCINCASNLQYCPVCRSTIKATVRTFLS